MVYWESNGQSHVIPKRCCEAVRSAILATYWLLVLVFGVFDALLRGGQRSLEW